MSQWMYVNTLLVLEGTWCYKVTNVGGERRWVVGRAKPTQQKSHPERWKSCTYPFGGISVGVPYNFKSNFLNNKKSFGKTDEFCARKFSFAMILVSSGCKSIISVFFSNISYFDHMKVFKWIVMLLKKDKFLLLC